MPSIDAPPLAPVRRTRSPLPRHALRRPEPARPEHAPAASGPRFAQHPRWRLALAALFVLLLALTPACTAPWRHGASAVDASPSEEESDEELRERVVLAMLDGETVYTVAGGLKPVSSGFWSTNIEVAQPDLTEIARLHRWLGGLRGVDEQLDFGVMSFAQANEGKRAAQAWVSHRGALAAAHEERTGEMPPREFAHIPTQGAEKHRFVWAVPSGHVENEADSELRRRAAPVLARYRALRERHIGPTRPGAVALLRATSRLHPPNARPESSPLTPSTP